MDWIAAYIAHLQKEGRLSKHTWQAYRADLLQLERYLNHYYEQSLAHCQTEGLRSWMAHLQEEGMHANTIRRKSASVKSFFAWMQKHAGSDPTTDARYAQLAQFRNKRRKPSSRLPHALGATAYNYGLNGHPSDFQQALQAAVIALMLGAGLRVQEVIDLEDSAYHRTERPGALAVLKVRGKGFKERLVPLPVQAAWQLDTFLIHKVSRHGGVDGSGPLLCTEKGQKLYRMAIYRWCRQWGRDHLKRDDVHPHALRHTYASMLLEQGAELHDVRQLLGHTTLAATQIYTRIATAHKKASYEQAHPRAHKT